MVTAGSISRLGPRTQSGRLELTLRSSKKGVTLTGAGASELEEGALGLAPRSPEDRVLLAGAGISEGRAGVGWGGEGAVGQLSRC